MSRPLADFKERLAEFATGQKRGIRNPFVMVPVDPPAEQKAGQHLRRWAEEDAEVPTELVYLDRVMPRTDVFRTVVDLPASFYQNGSPGERAEQEKKTLKDNLADEMVADMIEKHDIQDESEQILLLLHLGALYPFARASALLDEMDRQQVRATIGIPFPGEVIGGKLGFFGERAQHYYPAHRIEGQISMEHLQE